MSEKIISSFLTEVKEQKIKQIMGIVLDIEYWETIIKGKDEDKMRAELKTENEKKIENKNGTIFKDERDMDKIAKLSKSIEVLVKAQTELQKLKEMKIAIEGYLKFVMNPSKDTMAKFEEVVEL